MPGGALTAGASVSDLHRRSKDHEPSKLLVAGLVVGLLAGAFGIIEAWEAVTNRVVGSKLDEAVITSTGVVGVVHVVHSARGGSHAAYRLTSSSRPPARARGER